MEPSWNYWDVKASNVLTTENDSLMSWVFSDLVFEQLKLVQLVQSLAKFSLSS